MSGVLRSVGSYHMYAIHRNLDALRFGRLGSIHVLTKIRFGSVYFLLGKNVIKTLENEKKKKGMKN